MWPITLPHQQLNCGHAEQDRVGERTLSEKKEMCDKLYLLDGNYHVQLAWPCRAAGASGVPEIM